MVLPSGDQNGSPASSAKFAVSLRGCPPSAATTQRLVWKGPAPLDATYATHFPSGDQRPAPVAPADSTSLRTWPVATSSTYALRRSVSSSRGVGAAVKAIRDPSGDQRASLTEKSPLVICFSVPLAMDHVQSWAILKS